MNEVTFVFVFVVVVVVAWLLLFVVVHIRLRCCCWPFAPRHASFGAVGAFCLFCWVCVLVSVGVFAFCLLVLGFGGLCTHLGMAERGCRF